MSAPDPEDLEFAVPRISLKRILLLLTIPAALAGAWVGVTNLAGLCRSAAWGLVHEAHAEDTKAQIEAHAQGTHGAAATKVELAALAKAVSDAAAAATSASQVAGQALVMSAAGFCLDAGGRPHKRDDTDTGECVFLVGSEVEIVPLTDTDALLARVKLTRSVERAVRRHAASNP